MKYAVVKTGGKQYRVSEGDTIDVERLNSGKEVVFDQVLLYTADGVVKVGTPFLEGITVKASVIEDLKGEKIRVSKYKSKVRYRRVTGHRQFLTKIKIDQIGNATKAKKATPKEEAPVVADKKVTPKVKVAKKA